MTTIVPREPGEKQSRLPALGGLAVLALVLALASVFSLTALDVWLKQPFAWDASIAIAVHSFGTPWLDALMDLLTQAGELGAVIAALAVLAWCAWRRRWLDAASLAVSFGGAVALNTVVKQLFARARPAYFPPLVLESGYSFPSGHILASLGLYGLLAVLLWQGRRRLWAMLCVALILLVAFSRVYLGVHFPSDVLASLCLGTLWLCAVVALRQWALRRLRPPVDGAARASRS